MNDPNPAAGMFSQWQQAAIAAHELYQVYRQVGFSDEQAFELTKAVMEGSMRPKGLFG